MGEEISEFLKMLERIIEEMDIPFASQVKEELAEFRRLVTEQRPPRLALVGRRGSGKSSLINAIFGEHVAEVGHESAMTGEANWWDYAGERGTIEVLDTRGLQEGSSPHKEDIADTAKESIKKALEDRRADAIIFLVKASEVDAAIDGDIDALEELADWVEQVYGHRAPIVAVVTHCDILEPKKVELHNPGDFPDGDIQEKEDRVGRITSDLKQKLRDRDSLKDQLLGPIGVSSYISWRDDDTIRADDRWNIDRLTRYLVDELPDQAQYELARLSQVRFIQRRLANRLVHATSVVCGGIGAAPTPLADIAPITGAQLSMVVGIGYLSGRDLDMKTAAEFVGAMGVNAGAAIGFREAARALAQLIPVAGNAISGAIAFGATYGLGKAAIAYFIGEADADEARQVFEQTRDEAKEEYDQDEPPSPTSQTP
jgi:uncharacterized protein (DUF697 family)/GTP-binding protein EngB required for normal cell division